MRVLVTGGAGFIGSHLAQRLIENGHNVAVVDNLSTGIRGNVPREAEFIELDLAQPDCINSLPKGQFDVVCHLAAQSSGPASIEMPYYDLQANAASTLLLSRWCLQKGIPRFIYASSMAIYGDVAVLPVSEDALCLPRSYYGVSKLSSEHFLRLAWNEGLHVTNLRMFSVYGPGQNLGNLKQGMVSIFLIYLLHGETVPVTGSLNRFRDFIYIDDVIDVWIKVINMESTPSLSYNIGTGKRTTVYQLLATMIETLDLPTNYPICEKPGNHSDQLGLDADLSLVQAELNWHSVTSLENGLNKMIKWAQSLEKSKE